MRMPRALQLPPPPGPGRGYRQAGVTLGSDRGSHSLVGFLLESPEGMEKGSEKGLFGSTGYLTPTPETLRPQTPASRAVARALMSRTPFRHDT